jgi:hypothetical protein
MRNDLPLFMTDGLFHHREHANGRVAASSSGWAGFGRGPYFTGHKWFQIRLHIHLMTKYEKILLQTKNISYHTKRVKAIFMYLAIYGE